jgi:hypothetical protein
MYVNIFLVSHIWAKQFVEAGEMLHVAEAFIDKNYHPTVICRGNVNSTYGSSFLLVANHFFSNDMSKLYLIYSL